MFDCSQCCQPPSSSGRATAASKITSPNQRSLSDSRCTNPMPVPPPRKRVTDPQWGSPASAGMFGMRERARLRPDKGKIPPPVPFLRERVNGNTTLHGCVHEFRESFPLQIPLPSNFRITCSSHLRATAHAKASKVRQSRRVVRATSFACCEKVMLAPGGWRLSACQLPSGNPCGHRGGWSVPHHLLVARMRCWRRGG